MSFARFACRSLLAGYFIADGVQAFVNPDPRVADAEPWATKVVEWSNRVLPADLARRIPDKTETLVRIHGAAQTVGGLMLATGLFRRTGAALVAVAYVPKVFAARPTSLSADKLPFARELALLGGVLVAARDTEGKPNLAWMINDRRRFVSAQKRLTKKAAKTAQAAAKKVRAALPAAS